jgi:DNA-binding transcriptional LysR family regulator
MSTTQQPLLNLKLVQTFLLVAEFRSFREAAEQTHRSQSAITMQIKQLETLLGVSLFERTTRQVRLTNAGRQFLPSARRALAEVGLGLQRISESATVKRGRISLGCSPTIAAGRIAHILARFEREYPEVRISVREMAAREMFASMRNGDVEFCVGSLLPVSEFKFEPIMEDEFCALVPQSFLPDAECEIGFAELASVPVLLPNTSCALRALIEEGLRAAGIALATKYEFVQAQTMISMARAGLGVTILPRSVLPERPPTGMRILHIVPRHVRTVALISPRGQALSASAHRLAQLFRELIDPASATPGAAVGRPRSRAPGRQRERLKPEMA